MVEKTEARPKSGLPWEKGSLGQQMSWEGQVLGVVCLGEVVVMGTGPCKQALGLAGRGQSVGDQVHSRPTCLLSVSRDGLGF